MEGPPLVAFFFFFYNKPRKGNKKVVVPEVSAINRKGKNRSQCTRDKEEKLKQQGEGIRRVISQLHKRGNTKKF